MTVGKTNGTNGTNSTVSGRIDGDHRSLGDLFKDLADGTQTLISQEIRLAKLEISQGLKNASLGMGFFAGAAVFGLVGLIALAFTIVAVLALFLPVWLSALIVTVLFFAMAGVMALIGKGRLAHANPTPQETIQTLKEDQVWLKQQIK